MSDQTPWAEMNDDELMVALEQAVTETDTVSDRRRAAAQVAFTWRTVDAELADLLHDSALDAGAAVRSSGPRPEPRSLSFGSGDLTLEVEVDGTTVMGQVVGREAAAVAVQRAEGAEVTAEVDAGGFFRVEAVEPGPTRFVARAEGWALTSPWVVL